MARLGQAGGVAVAFIGKLKTTIQMIAILLLLYYEDIGIIPIGQIGLIMIYIAAFLTLASMLYYLKISIRTLKNIK